MTAWTGKIYLLGQREQDHVADVTLPGPLSLSRRQIEGLELPDGYRLSGASELTPAVGSVPRHAVLHEVRPSVWRGRLSSLAIEQIAFDSPPRISASLPCPEQLEQALLPASDGARLYLLFDAAVLMPLLKVFDPTDLIDDRRGAALFLSERIQRQSPWLVDVTPTESGEIPRLLRQYLRHAWNRRTGIFLQTGATFDELFHFLRGFTRVGSGDDDGKTILLRYWDPLIARHWFAGQGGDPARVSRLFWTASGESLCIIGETGATGFFRISPTFFSPEVPGRKGLLTLGTTDKQALQNAAMQTLGRQLSQWAIEARPERFTGFTHRRLAAMETHVLSVGQRYQLRRKEDFAALLNVMMVLGGWFHQSGAGTELVEILDSGGAEIGDRLTEALTRLAPLMPQARIAAKWREIASKLAAIPVEARLEGAAFRSLTAEIADADDPRIVPMVQATLRDISRLGLSRNETGVVLALTLIYGFRYYDDPLRDWALSATMDKQALMSLSSRIWPRRAV